MREVHSAAGGMQESHIPRPGCPFSDLLELSVCVVLSRFFFSVDCFCLNISPQFVLLASLKVEF